jgi:hypothetical protein
VSAADLDTLRSRLSSLEAEAATIRAILDPDRGPAPRPRTRRDALRLAGAAIVGVAVAGHQNAAAEAANGFVLSSSATLFIAPVRNWYAGGVADASGFVFLSTSGVPQSNVDPAANATLAGWAELNGTPRDGVYGRTVQPGGNGVHGRSIADTGSGAGVIGEGTNANAGTIGLADNGVGVGGLSGTGIGVSAVSINGLGLQAVGRRAGIRVVGGGAPPGSVSGASQVGMIQCDTTGHLWLCVAAGDPGTWRRVGGPSAAGAYHAVIPGRVYDSRNAGAGGPIHGDGTPRTISLLDRLDPSSGSITQAGFVPDGATALTANVTVVNTVGAGFLTINPGTDAVVHAATANWSATGQILNNGVNFALDAQRRVTLVAGGGGATDVVIDITGYYL